MPLIRNISGEDRQVPWLGRVVFDEQTVEVPADQVCNFTQQESNWAPADGHAEALHAEMLEGIADLIAASNPAAELVEESNADDLVKALGSMDADEVDALVAAENARPRPRKTVLKAAESRRSEFDNDDPNRSGDDSQED